MTPHQNNDETISKKRRVAVFYDEVTRQKINRHLSDINDTISDEDISNVITDIRSGSSDSGLNTYPVYGSSFPQ